MSKFQDFWRIEYTKRPMCKSIILTAPTIQDQNKRNKYEYKNDMSTWDYPKNISIFVGAWF